jgi:hypothetical protein
VSVEPLASLAELVRDLGFLVYGGSMLSFTALVTAAARRSSLSSPVVVRAFQAWGPGLGLSLGAVVSGALAAHYLRIGAWSWVPSTGIGWTGLFAWLAFFALWASNVVLEVWTLEPLRKRPAPSPDSPDEAGWSDARVKLESHMQLQSALVLLTFLFTWLAAR